MQVYGNGKSEEILGRFVNKYGLRDKLQVATKVRAGNAHGQATATLRLAATHVPPRMAADAPCDRRSLQFAPLPWRVTSSTVEEALRSSLQRMGLPKVALYIIHWPGAPTNAGDSDLSRVRGDRGARNIPCG